MLRFSWTPELCTRDDFKLCTMAVPLSGRPIVKEAAVYDKGAVALDG